VDTMDKLIVALDVPDLDKAKGLMKQLGGEVKRVKIGLELFTKEGSAVIDLANEQGFEVFLDLKLHDIPNTVSSAVKQIAGLNVFMTTLHCLGGLEMLQAAKSALKESKSKPLLVGVTVLTSHNEKSLQQELGIAGSVQENVLRYAKLAKQAGLDGVVASPHELQVLKSTLGDSFKVVTPGVRPAGSDTQDQKRVMTPREAIQLGADYIVVGRPITQAKDPKGAALKILEEIHAN